MLLEIISFFAAIHNNAAVAKLVRIAPQECEAKMLSKQTMIALGIKGSPKLSKALVALGLQESVVSKLLSATERAVSAQDAYVAYKSDQLVWLLDQGNSKHYSSCQATKAKHLVGWQGGQNYNNIKGDKPFWAKDLFLWVVGQPMSLDNGTGFKSRAKLRVMRYENGQVAGLYIDRPYGNSNLLLSSIPSLQQWWANYSDEQGWSYTPLLIAPLWERENGEGRDFESRFGGAWDGEPLYCPSAQDGYQDTLTRGEGPYTCFVKINTQIGSLTRRAYEGRPKVEQTYLHSLSDVSYNPQKAELTYPSLDYKPWRGFVTEQDRECIRKIMSKLGRVLKL